ncbi:MAG: RsmB/NOP family class I SAM-dependent RNA methyltransferase [Xanthobacteraceae bacterium]
MTRPQRVQPAEVPGLSARRIAVDILDDVLRRRRPLDDHFEGEHAHPGLPALADRDRALVRKLVATVLRRLGTLRRLLNSSLDRGLPDDAPRLEMILLVGAGQIIWLDVPDHAAVDLAVRLAQADRRASRYAGLVNAVLRRIARERASHAGAEPGLDTPDWLMARWRKAYGAQIARAIAEAHSHEPPLDLTVKSEPQSWAARLRGRDLPTGTVRLMAHGPVSRLPGYMEGAWWVQDAAAALPARLLGDVHGRTVADLCAAPGGKTAQLAHAGAQVTAIDRSPVRLARLKDNLARLALAANVVSADVLEWQGGPFDAVLVDAPCSSTGTIRRHPDIMHLKRDEDLAALVAVQRQLIDRAVALTRPGGTVVYCSCSLEPEEGEAQIAALLERDPRVRRSPISASEIGGLSEFVTAAGELRTLPCHLPDPDPRMAGLDGFYAARLYRL